MFANENAKIEPRASYVVLESGSWIYKTEGKAKSDDSTYYLATRGKGYTNYYFKVFVRNADGKVVVDADASNGVERLAQTKKTSSLANNHTHTATGMLMW